MPDSITISADKKQVLHKLIEWYRHNYQTNAYISVGGYAGTGKTTLIALLRKIIHKKNPKLKTAFVSYTGKAARVLQQYLKSTNSVYPKDFAGTIHSLIYSPRVDNRGVIVGWDKKDKLDFDLILIDEASMVDYDIWQDMLSFNIPIMAFGDHGQLPPIKGSFSLMASPDLTLETIHRQAQDNPIIKLSIMARQTGEVPPGKYSSTVMKLSQSDWQTQEKLNELIQEYDQDTLILCGYNWTRVELNKNVRQALGIYEDEPQPGDRVICLRNNHQKGIYNGMLGVIKSINSEDKDWFFAQIEMDGEADLFEGLIARQQFGAKEPLNFTKQRQKTVKGDLFDFGYALTVHKAQGSQAKRVILLEQRFSQMSDQEWRRWLYTGVTRAEEELYLVGE
ncbi:MAG: AAA family ATPase [Candidatus Pacebacteria bacterium]|nr:AAA family ATPase [Candidatus Paceibacterota bacterium]